MKESNLFERVAKIRCELGSMNLKKSGHNKFAGFYYYELCDFLPQLNQLCEKHEVLTHFYVAGTEAFLKVVDSTKKDSPLEFTIPFLLPEIKGANSVQNLGGAITYLRRYLLMIAFEIVEHDVSDAIIGRDKTQERPASKPVAKPVAKPSANNKQADDLKDSIFTRLNELMDRDYDGTLQKIKDKGITSKEISETNNIQKLSAILAIVEQF